GFIGSALCRRLKAQGARVTCVDNLSYAACPQSVDALFNTNACTLVREDIRNVDAIKTIIVENKPDIIFHLAAESHVDRSIDDPKGFLSTNTQGTVAVLTGAQDYWKTLSDDSKSKFRFVHVSTDEVYGSLHEGEADENHAYRPNSPYSASKAASDHFVRAWNVTYGLPTLMTHCSNNYGPYQYPEKLIPKTILRALDGKEIPVYGDGLNMREWIHVDDHVDALLVIAAKAQPGSRYNIGGGADGRITNIDLVKKICAALDHLHPKGAPHNRLITFVADRPGHDLRYALDSRKIADDLGWSPKNNISTRISDIVQWYIDHRQLWDNESAYR
ncbi:MAG TPA: dTDP-glucose 4,6-dehydratase, partial [Alphaproteobacteria bacterium]